MDITIILVIVFGGFFLIGGPIIGHYASKASEKFEKELKDKANSK